VVVVLVLSVITLDYLAAVMAELVFLHLSQELQSLELAVAVESSVVLVALAAVVQVAQATQTLELLGL
jgi:hypothetical protein